MARPKRSQVFNQSRNEYASLYSYALVFSSKEPSILIQTQFQSHLWSGGIITTKFCLCSATFPDSLGIRAVSVVSKVVLANERWPWDQSLVVQETTYIISIQHRLKSHRIPIDIESKQLGTRKFLSNNKIVSYFELTTIFNRFWWLKSYRFPIGIGSKQFAFKKNIRCREYIFN